MLKIYFIGTQENPKSFALLFELLEKYTLRPDLENMGLRCFDYDEFSAPFRSAARCAVRRYYCPKRNSDVYVGTKPIYPEHENMVSFSGAFLEASYAFRIDTNEPDTIAQLDAAIAQNMDKPSYKEAMAIQRERYAYRFLDGGNVPKKPDFSGFPNGSETTTQPRNKLELILPIQ